MSKKRSVNRRNFLKQAAVTGAAAALVPASGRAATLSQAAAPPTRAVAPIPPREVDPPRRVEVETIDRPGGDFMVDVLKTLNFDYIASNPGSSFRGIHESIINYGNNQSPEFLTCCHEESSVAMAPGYFKAEGKPMAVLCHGTVGI
ncbi:MAG: twin-arginine translocation signal domain-containing protein, partial [Planctomycetaceae bacterium]